MILDTNPSEYLNEKVILKGVAENAKAGAVVVLSDGASVYIDKLESWDEQWFKKRIKVTGILRKKKLAPDPVMNEKGEWTAGMPGMATVLEEATWEEVSHEG